MQCPYLYESYLRRFPGGKMACIWVCANPFDRRPIESTRDRCDCHDIRGHSTRRNTDWIVSVAVACPPVMAPSLHCFIAWLSVCRFNKMHACPPPNMHSMCHPELVFGWKIPNLASLHVKLNRHWRHAGTAVYTDKSTDIIYISFMYL
eukprot:SAG31_NODE_1008_length_10407_cov_2.369131_10_plen_148_part_00